MLKRRLFLFHAFLISGLSGLLSAQSTPDEPEILGPATGKGGATVAATTLQARAFTLPGMVGSVVAIAVADDGTVYLTQTYRRNNGEPDIRKNPSWLEASLASRSVEDKRAIITSRMKDWKKMAAFEEKIIRLRDLDGDGKADERVVHFSGLNNEVDGLAAGLAWSGGSLFLTCTPGFYRLEDADHAGDRVEAHPLAYGFGIHIGYGGHDMHGALQGPDGRLYWSQGDRGAMVTDDRGVTHANPCQGAVFRIEPDGSGFEIFAHGLRNPQEIAFDEFGNLFTVDNDGDFGDQERWVFIPQGSDSGWRMPYQFRSSKPWGSKTAYNPWMADGLYLPAQAGQPAYLTPPLLNYSAGPIGFVKNPGTALDERYRDFFFLAHSNKRLTAFRAEPLGAGFRMLDEHEVLRGPFITGIEFGPDGALYGADWGDNKWEPHEKGGVLVVDNPSPSVQQNPLRLETKRLLGQGTAGLDPVALVEWLNHADQRVRLAGQFALVKAGPEGEKALRKRAADTEASLLARVHAIWGLGQLARQSTEVSSALAPLLTDAVAEIRAQAARVLGDSRGGAGIADAVALLLSDPEPRVRLQAGLALNRLGGARHLAPVLALLQENAGTDRYLRHAGIMALTAAGKESKEILSDLAGHASIEVRLAAVVALRRLGYGDELVPFLHDTSPEVAAEAARAIHDDESLPGGLEALAESLSAVTARSPEALVRRAVSANRLLGTRPAALRLADFIASGTATPAVRAEALETLATWSVPFALDRVQGWYRGLPAASSSDAHLALDHCIGAGLGSPDEVVRAAATLAVKSLAYTQALPRLEKSVFDGTAPVEQRISALGALRALNSSQLGKAVRACLQAGDSALRTAALTILAQTEPTSAELPGALDRALAAASLDERQVAWSLLARRQDPSAREHIARAMDRLEGGELPEGERLDVYLAAHGSEDPTLVARAKAWEAAAQGRDPILGFFALALEGGNSSKGRQIAEGHLAAQCTGCHRLDPPLPGASPGTGPDLAGVGSRRDRSYLLRAVVNPSADIDEAYRLTQFALKSGETVFGTVAAETSETVTIRLPGAPGANVIREVPTTEILSRQSQNVSIMPPMSALLTPLEIRDLVAFLASQKESP